jgi:hypothetical protein
MTAIDDAKLDQLTRERDAWIETARQHARNEDFYRGIVTQIGEMFGEAARTSDDGSVQQSVLALKVPELVADERAKSEGLTSERDALRQLLAHIHLHLTNDEEFDADELERDIRNLDGGKWIDTETLLIDERAKSEGLRAALEQQLAWLMNQPFEWLHPVQIALVQAALSSSPAGMEEAVREAPEGHSATLDIAPTNVPINRRIAQACEALASLSSTRAK